MELLGAFCKNGGGPKDNRTFLIGIFHVAAKAPSWSARRAEHSRRRASSQSPPFEQKGIWTAPFAQREVFEKFCWCRNKTYMTSWRLSVSSDRLSVNRMNRLQTPAIKHFCGSGSLCAALFRNNKLKRIINKLFKRGLYQDLNWQTHPNMLF